MNYLVNALERTADQVEETLREELADHIIYAIDALQQEDPETGADALKIYTFIRSLGDTPKTDFFMEVLESMANQGIIEYKWEMPEGGGWILTSNDAEQYKEKDLKDVQQVFDAVTEAAEKNGYRVWDSSLEASYWGTHKEYEMVECFLEFGDDDNAVVISFAKMPPDTSEVFPKGGWDGDVTIIAYQGTDLPLDKRIRDTFTFPHYEVPPYQVVDSIVEFLESKDIFAPEIRKFEIPKF
jgi:hypothetical protein